MLSRLALIILLTVLFVVACSDGENATPTAAPPEATDAAVESFVGDEADSADEEPIYLSIIWHQHQPVYFKDPETNVYVRPWVRVHASKDYVDMAAMLEQYPDIHATFNLTPSLIRQLDDLQAGAKDLYWVHTEIPADELTDDQKQFILERFFDTNRKIIERFPRYQELLVKRDAADDPLAVFEEADYRDLQLLFNLAWTDPDWLAEEPLAALVAKGSGFSEEDKAVVLAEHLRLIGEVIPVHRALQDAGQIEVTMTPFAHPILPLLVSTNLATEALPGIELPETTFQYGGDAQRQVELGVQLYEDHFGRPPQGMWPAEGSVAQEIVSMVATNGIQWMATDEGVLANSLGFDSFTRDNNDVVQEADQLYRPYYVQGGIGDPVAIVFRDVVISDKVGFTYSGVPGAAAAQDFVSRIHDIREQLRAGGEEGPFLVSVILDGENAWEHYENDGKEFLNTLYQLLSDDPLIRTVTPSEFLEIAPDQPAIDDLWAGSWISHDFSTWIGEEEENRAWDYLAETREVLRKYEQGIREIDGESLAAAQDLMYIAEGSDWFWWYGSDQNSGNDDIFDQQFRDTLRQVYLALNEEPPAFLDIPVIPQQAVDADRASSGLLSPTIDGRIDADEWEAGGVYLASGGVMASGQPAFESLTYGFDAGNLYLLIDLAASWDELLANGNLDIFMQVPGSDPAADFSNGGNPLGFSANRLVQIVRDEDAGSPEAGIYTYTNDEWSVEAMPEADIAGAEDVIELALPLDALGGPDMGDNISLRLYYSQPTDVSGETIMVDADQLPGAGPAQLSVPDLGTTTIVMDVVDPTGDDHGPGTYSYPTDAVFNNGNFDIVNFQVGFDDENIVFRFTMDGPVDNPWGGGNGLSLQTFDVYIDQDGDATGGRAMLPGRNLAFDPDYAWDFAITVEGWESGIFTPTADGGQEQIAEASEFSVLTDSGQQKVTIRVPKVILGDAPDSWRYAAVVLSQEGFPSAGVMRVRDVMPAAEQWRIGGAPAGATNHTRVMDLVWPEEGQQEAWLSAFAISDVSQPELTADDFATVPMLQPE
jgi:alpha-amylase/alpha-mannosidase (GH57 family)